MIGVLFVCLGNICRSPAAEGVFINLISTDGLTDKFIVDSAGTSAYHAGQPADERMRLHSEKRGISLPSISRQFVYDDFKNFEYIITMDRSNYNNVISLAKTEADKKRVIPMSHLCAEFSITDVPDPYYGGEQGFEEVLDIVTDGCTQLLNRIKLEKFNS